MHVRQVNRMSEERATVMSIVASGSGGTLAVTSTGDLYGWGRTRMPPSPSPAADMQSPLTTEYRLLRSFVVLQVGPQQRRSAGAAAV